MKRAKKSKKVKKLSDTFVVNKKVMDYLNQKRDIHFLQISELRKRVPLRRTTKISNHLVGSGGLEGIDWNVFVCLLEHLDLCDAVILCSVCKHLNYIIGPFFKKISDLVKNFSRNKLSLSLWLDTINLEKVGIIPTFDRAPRDMPYSVEFLIYQIFKTFNMYVYKTLFKVTLPSNEVLLVCQSFITDTNLIHHGLCINYKNKKDYLYYTTLDDEGWNKDPHKFLRKYCGLLSLKTPEDVFHFFCNYGKISNEDILENTEISSDDSPKIDFELLFEFGLHQAIYTQFMKDLKQIVFHKHIKNQLLRLLPQHLRTSHFTQNWKKRIVDSNYCEFPETKEMDQLLERMSLSDLIIKDIDRSYFEEFKFEAKFLIYLKHLDEYSTLELSFNHTNFFLNIKIFLETSSTAESESDLVFFLNDQLETKWSPELWHWAFLAISSTLLDTLGVSPLKMTKQWKAYQFSEKKEEKDSYEM